MPISALACGAGCGRGYRCGGSFPTGATVEVARRGAERAAPAGHPGSGGRRGSHQGQATLQAAACASSSRSACNARLAILRATVSVAGLAPA